MTNGTQPPDPMRVRALTTAVQAAVRHDTGMSAVLRRLDPEDHVGVPALHLILVKAGVRDRDLEGDGLERHATCVRIIAILATVQGNEVSPGKGLAELELSDQRMARLTTARERSLRDQVTSTVRRAVSKGLKLNPRPLCEIILSDGATDWKARWGDNAKQALLRDYYRVSDAKAA
jgi:hypothetical protein